MKKLVLLALMSTFLVANIFAQDAFGLYKKANKAYVSYNTSQNFDKLNEAKKTILEATKGIDQIDAKHHAKVWNLQGNIYKELANNLLPNIKAENPNAGLIAYAGYKNTLALEGAKKWYYTTATTGLKELSGSMINDGASAYEAKDYNGALKYFNAVLDIKEVLDAQGDNSLLETAEKLEQIYQYAGVTALLAKDKGAAIDLYKSMLKKGIDKDFVYDGLYKSMKEDNEAEAVKWLEEGRAKHPGSKTLLYNEINMYLGSGKMDVLVGRLKEAIAQDPENKTLYSTLGNVYDNLYQKKFEAAKKAEGDEKATLTKTADDYFADAEKYYKMALEKDNGYFEVHYGLGALKFNKAAFVVNERNQLPFSAEKEYAALGKKATELFQAAYTNFVAAEKINPNDRSLLIAFKELYANTSNLEQSNEYKDRLAKLKADATTKFEAYTGHPGVEKVVLK